MVTQSKSFERYQLKKTIDVISKKKGYHTELISVYIPPNKRVTDVMNNLRNEAATAVNIKSRLTRRNVTDALAVAQQRLRLITKIPDNGLVLFVGAIPQTGPGTEKMEVYLFEPPEHLNVYRYLCSSEFWIDPLLDMLTEKEAFGLIAISRNVAAIATLRGSRLTIATSMTSGIPGKHRAGGQSQRRYERVIEQLAHEFMIRIGEAVNDTYLPIEDLRGILVGGSGFTKEQFLEGTYMDPRLKKRVLAVVDLGYGGEEGIRELLIRGKDHLENVRYLDEKALMQAFLSELARDTGLATYGEKEVRQALVSGAVDKLLLSENLDFLRVSLKCSHCGLIEKRSVKTDAYDKLENEISTAPCPKCNSENTWNVESSVNLVDELGELASQTNTTIEVISAETEEGNQLLKAFGGIAAILRFKLDV
jgi:peptide chain release factor subunit 1